MPTSQQQTEQPSQWAVLELFGHSRIAGRVSEQTIAGATFVRVDVPAVHGLRNNWRNGANVEEHYSIPEHTRTLGPAAIYSINWLDEAAARIVAAQLLHQPVSAYGLADALGTLPEDQRLRLPLPLFPAGNGNGSDSVPY
jgi:hypothetical protein